MPTKNWFQKQSGEKYTIAVDFSSKLPSGRSVSSCTVTATDYYDESDVASTVLADGTAVVSSDVCSEVVQAGTSGRTYEIKFIAVLDNTSTLYETIQMYVED